MIILKLIFSHNCLEITLRSIGVFFLYSIILFFTSLFTFEPSSTPLFWPANAIILVIMLYSAKHRAMIYLASAGVSYFSYIFYFDAFGLGPSILLSSSNMIEIVSGYLMITYFVSQPLQFNRIKNSIELIFYGVILNSLIGATVGTFLMRHIWESPSFISWSMWFGTSSIGCLMILPLMISWLSPNKRKYNLIEIVAIILIFIVCILISLLIFTADQDKPFIYPYFVFPILLLTAMRFDVRIISITFLIFITISSICSSMAMGPFALGQYYREIVLLRFQLFCGITTITVIIVSALQSERELLIKELQDALSQIKTLSGFIPICAHCKKIRDDSGYWNQLETYIQENSDAQLSHGICPTCAEKYYGKYLTNKDKTSIEYNKTSDE
jgi:integral membrane sensor domain MASE1